jgi:hypothetical protein
VDADAGGIRVSLPVVHAPEPPSVTMNDDVPAPAKGRRSKQRTAHTQLEPQATEETSSG